MSKTKTWQQLPQFITWDHYHSMNQSDLKAHCDHWRECLAAVRAEMSHKEIIVGRSQRYKAWLQSKSACDRVADLIQS